MSNAGKTALSRRARLLQRMLGMFVVGADKPLAKRRAAMERAGRIPLARHVQWRRDVIAGVPVIRVSPQDMGDGRVIVHLHGGGYCIGSARSHLPFASRLAKAARAEIVLVDYRLAPEHPFPAAIDDSVAVTQAVLQHHRPGCVTLSGDSSGGGAVVAAACRLRDLGAPLPNGLYLLSPFTDQTFSGDTIKSNAGLDPMVDEALVAEYARLYRNGLSPEDPAVSPLFADLRGLPPILVQVGSDEILLSDSSRFVERACSQGVDAKLEIGEGLWHVYPMTAGLMPEADAALERAANAIRSWGLTEQLSS